MTKKTLPDGTVIEESCTFKVVVPNHITSNKIYFTIVGDQQNPHAFFINCKDIKTFEWLTVLMTSFSRQIGAGIPIANIIADMKEAFDPNGKYIIPDGTGREVNSLVHHLGLILESYVGAQ